MNNYLLAGNSSFLKEETVDKIRANLFSTGLVRVDVEVFNAQENTLSQVLDAARTFPFFSPQRVVILRSVDLLEGASLQELISYLKNPQKTSTLILITQDEKINNSWIQPFKEHCHIHLLNIPYENQLDSWIFQRVSQSGKKIYPQGAKLLNELTGNDLRNLAAEISKLILYVRQRGVITLADVEQLAVHSVHYSGFVLGDAICARDLSKALVILSRMFEEQKSAPEIVGLISWEIQRLLQGKQRLQRGENWEQLMRDFRIVSPFLMKKFQQKLIKWELLELKSALRSLLETDIAIKTGQGSGRLALEGWLLKI